MTEEEKLYKQYMDLIGPEPSDWVKKLIVDIPMTASNLLQFKVEYHQFRDIVGPNPATWVIQVISGSKRFPISQSNLIKCKEEYATQRKWEEQLKLIKGLVSKKEGEDLPALPLSREQMFEVTQKYKERLPPLIKRQKIIDTLMFKPLWKQIVSLFSKTRGEIQEHQMVYIPAGDFMMGARSNDGEAWKGEKPRHKVRISRPFWLGKYPVTQEQYESVMGKNPSRFKGPIRPVE